MRLPLLISLFALGCTSQTLRAAVDFETQVLPIFTAHCIKCHGEENAAGKLRLHTAAVLQEKMARDDHLIVAGQPEQSELVERLLLPADNKKRMPKGADPLEQASIDVISQWIQEGAAFAKPAAGKAAVSTAAAAAAVAPARPKPLPLPEVAAAPAAAVEQLRAAGAQVTPLFAESNLLDVSFALRSQPADDAALALLAPLAPQVFRLNLRGAQATPAGWAELAKLTNLSKLAVDQANFSDDAAHHLATLSRLESLNLYGTTVTDAALEPLRGLKHLGKLYLWKTGVSYDAAVGLERDLPGLDWNLGWDHPVVARKRLEKQHADLAVSLKTQQETTARLQAELQAAEAGQATLEQRLQEIDAQLEKLAAPAAKPSADPVVPPDA